MTSTTERQARLHAFWRGESLGRPALAIRSRRERPTHDPASWPATWADAKARERDPAWQAELARQSLDAWHHHAESTPKATVSFASNIALIPALLGAEYDLSTGTAWVHPDPEFLERPVPEFDPGHPLAQDLVASLRAVAEVVRGRGRLNPLPFGLDAWTTLSLLAGSDVLCLGLLDNPEPWVARQREISRFITTAFQYFHAQAEALDGPGSCTWFECWHPGRFEAVQCDFAVFLSPDHFREFVLPDLQDMVNHCDGSLYHLDGTAQLRFLDQLAEVEGLNGIQWNPEPGAQDPTVWLDTFRAIRERGWLLYFNEWECRTVEHAVAITEAVGPDGLFLSLPAFDTPEEAEAAVEAIAAASRRTTIR